MTAPDYSQPSQQPTAPPPADIEIRVWTPALIAWTVAGYVVAVVGIYLVVFG